MHILINDFIRFLNILNNKKIIQEKYYQTHTDCDEQFYLIFAHNLLYLKGLSDIFKENSWTKVMSL